MGKAQSKQLFQSHLYSFKKIRTLFLPVFGVILYGSFLFSCANKGTLTGGEKDTIPPTLISSFPIQETLNFDGTEIILTFDERIQALQLQRKLLITPFSDVKYKVKADKNVLQLNFEEPFADSTTYTINFADGVTDVTENNPVLNLSLAFSTGDVIDSLFIFGKVINLMTNLPPEVAGISLYPANDTLDIFSGKPYYFTYSDEKGAFRINNMKNGEYRIYAFIDENNNFLNESGQEPHGFLPDTFNLSDFSDSLTIKLYQQDVQELKLVNSRALGSHFDVRFNKPIVSYSLSTLDSSSSSLKTHITPDSLILRFYNSKIPLVDSAAYIVHAVDKVGNFSNDTVYAKFTDREIKFEALKLNVSPPDKAQVLDQIMLNFTFNKPINYFNGDSLLVKYDTLRTDRLDSITDLTWNNTKTELTAILIPDRQYLIDLEALNKLRSDSIKILQDSLKVLGIVDTTSLVGTPKGSSKDTAKPLQTNRLRLYLGKGAFISIENDSSKLINYIYSYREPEKYGKISGIVQTASTSFFIQLIDQKFKVIDEVYNQKNYQFEFVPPGKYKIRVLIDSNLDGQWSAGNVREWKSPEPIYFFPEFIELRENWEINEINLNIENIVDKL
ncbi:MAG: Ig-like domain-containing domain [Bacteroidetes bacterium]|nr:Ig-like domain-containing domain [Bacteroidota bacterium]MDA1119005.1 Ig-like domain-containing domain [Bacteroidota bacterium]